MSRRLPADLGEQSAKSSSSHPPRGGMKSKRSPKKTNRLNTVSHADRHNNNESGYNEHKHPHELVESVSISSLDYSARRFQPPFGSYGRVEALEIDVESADYPQMSSIGPSEGPEPSYNMDDGVSIATTSDALPDSATFFEELPIASNNDFDLTLMESTQSRTTTATHSTQTTRGLRTSLMSPPSTVAALDSTPQLYDSTASTYAGALVPVARSLQRLFEPSANDSAASILIRASTYSMDANDTYYEESHHSNTPHPDGSFIPRRSARLSLGPR